MRVIRATSSRGGDPGEDPFAALGIPRGSPRAAVRVRYLEIMRRLHPDVSKRDTTEAAARINAAYEAVLLAYRRGEEAEGVATEASVPFDRSEGEADYAFVNPFACDGVDPLDWRLLQEARKYNA